MFRWTKTWTVLAVLLLTASMHVAALAADTVTYSQHHYDKLDKAQTLWHRCDFTLTAKIAGDFLDIATTTSQVLVTMEKVGSGEEETIIAGAFSDLGAISGGPKGGHVVFAPGIYNYSGSGSVSGKAFTLKLSAKTSEQGSDATNFLLPIDEPIVDAATDKALPPFTGQAYLRISLRGAPSDQWDVHEFLIDYSGRNTYISGKVLPSQMLKGKV